MQESIYKDYTTTQNILRDDTERFSPLSLTDWLCKADLCGINHVPATTITHFETADCINADIHGPHQKRLKKAWREIRANVRPNHMMRWDCCASMWLKSEINSGNFQWCKEFGYVHHPLADGRLLDILYGDWGRVLVPVLQRPWVTPMIIDNYPVEYRVFVQEGVITGISNYYPQRPLPYRMDDLKAVILDTLKLIDSLIEGWGDMNPDELLADLSAGKNAKRRDHRSFTVDYMVLPGGMVVLLEGGPAHRKNGGAHPCCFEPGNVEGIALEEGAKPMEINLRELGL